VGENEDRGKLSAVMLQCDILESIQAMLALSEIQSWRSAAFEIHSWRSANETNWLVEILKKEDKKLLRSTVGDAEKASCFATSADEIHII